MLRVVRFVNELMASNCYLVFDEEIGRCIVVDPGSEKSERESSFLKENLLQLDFIIITHEHTDHNWGVNELHKQFPQAKIVCSEECGRRLRNANDMYFLFYYDDPDYKYIIDTPNIIIHNSQENINSELGLISFVITPGHSYGSMCIDINGILFTGDTIMPYKPYFNGRDSNQDDWDTSINLIEDNYPTSTIIYPGHGESLTLGEWMKQYG